MIIHRDLIIILPSADRLKSLNLFKKSLDDTLDDRFVELARIENGILRSKKETTI